MLTNNKSGHRALKAIVNKSGYRALKAVVLGLKVPLENNYWPTNWPINNSALNSFTNLFTH